MDARRTNGHGKEKHVELKVQMTRYRFFILTGVTTFVIGLASTILILTSQQPPSVASAPELEDTAESDQPDELPLKLKPAGFDELSERSMKEWRKLFRASRLKDLEQMELASDEAEIRVWTLPGYVIGRTKCWRFYRTSGQWNAAVFIDRAFEGRAVWEALEGLDSGGSKWDAYANENLTPERVHEAARYISLVNDESGGTIVEVRFGSKWRREFMHNDRLLTALFRTVKSEVFGEDEDRWTKY